MGRQIFIFSTVMIVATAALFAFLLDGRGKSGGNEIERRTEIWAHQRLMAARINAEDVPFTTDGCSGGMSAIWKDASDTFPALRASIGDTPPWENCCVIHDKAYFDASGATDAKQSFDARLLADQNLSKCVANFGKQETTPIMHQYQLLADMMYSAVRLGGAPCSGLPWRWGYGLPNCYIGYTQESG
jgi:hypothetical protein